MIFFRNFVMAALGASVRHLSSTGMSAGTAGVWTRITSAPLAYYTPNSNMAQVTTSFKVAAGGSNAVFEMHSFAYLVPLTYPGGTAAFLTWFNATDVSPGSGAIYSPPLQATTAPPTTGIPTTFITTPMLSAIGTVAASGFSGASSPSDRLSVVLGVQPGVLYQVYIVTWYYSAQTGILFFHDLAIID